MGLFAPFALLFGLLALPIIVMYLLHPRSRERRISSTFLWREALQELQSRRASWRLRPPSLLFLIQLIVLALLVLALARPYLQKESSVQGNLVLLLDASASMRATDVSPSRFAQAQREAFRLIDQLAPESEMTVIRVEEVPQILISNSSDRIALKRSVEQARPGTGRANLASALSLTASLIQEGMLTQVFILSDGNVVFESYLDELPFQVRHIATGGGRDNLTLAAFSGQRSEDGLAALARISIASDTPQETTLELYIDDVLYDVRRVQVNPGEDAEVRWQQLPIRAEILEARLVPGDSFSLDDRAWALVGLPGSVRTLMVSPGNHFLETALRLQPGIELTMASPGEVISSSGYGLWVFDGYLPRKLPVGPILIINPPPDTAPWPVGEPVAITGLNVMDDALLKFSGLSRLRVLRARPVSIPVLSRVLVDSSEGPLVAVWEEADRRVALFTFDLHDSDLPLQPAFPILMQNVLGWIVPGLRPGTMVRSGEVVELSMFPDAHVAWVELPDGQQVQVVPLFPPPPFDITEQLGVYHIVQQAGDREMTSAFAVNLFTPEESSMALVEDLDTLGVSVSEDTKTVVKVPWELAPWIAMVALLFLSAEWWMYSRGN